MVTIKEINESIQITKYNPEWPALFEQEKASLQKIFGNVPIEHFGSTAIPGLTAKPIIDILVGLPALTIENHSIELAKLGYTGFGEAGVPGRLYFIKRLPSIGYNLAVTIYKSDLWNNNIILRDYLRTHPEEVKQYAQIKEDILTSGAATLLEYSERKHEFVHNLLNKARLWAKIRISN